MPSRCKVSPHLRFGRLRMRSSAQVTVVGDLHGQLYDFDHMLSLAGFPSPDNQFLFNGDFVDRGPWSVEVGRA